MNYAYDPETDRQVRTEWGASNPELGNTALLTPWGPAQHLYKIADGVTFISTASHGGLLLSDERVKQLPKGYIPFNTARKWAEEDCDMPKVLDFLGLNPVDWKNIECVSL